CGLDKTHLCHFDESTMSQHVATTTAISGSNDKKQQQQQQHVVIVGGGITGITCAQAYRTLKPKDRITLVSQTPLLKSVFNVNKLSRTLEEFDVKECSPSDVFADGDIDIVIGTVVQVKSITRIIHISTSSSSTSTNSTLHYDYLCMCTGARPNVIKVNDQLQSYIIGIRDTETVNDLKNRLQGAQRVVIVGNGGIAMELVHEITSCQVIWAIKDEHIGNAFFDMDASEFLTHSRQIDSAVEETPAEPDNFVVVDRSSNEPVVMSNDASIGPQWYDRFKFIGCVDGSKINSNKVEPIIEYCTTVQSVDKGDDEWPVYVNLSNGKRYGCNFIVSATGVIPNDKIEFVPSTTAPTTDNMGYILVNDTMQTSVGCVFAAGDACHIQWSAPAPYWFQMKLWSQARVMGRYVAQCMATQSVGPDRKDSVDVISTVFEFELFAHVTRFFNMKVVMLGLYNSNDVATGFDPETMDVYQRVIPGKTYVKVILKNGRMQGALLIGETDLEETFENLIHNQIDLSRYGASILDPDIDIEDYFD
ncbi:hypothetical protein SAMD00019534_073800, partial [Acytostelium subglobosum LB1]|uniref:hypothetical protein n=1 Tax=Acytostelium subglobosum LB1 TaxID=1410327 RepID=UPI000644AF0D